MPEKTISLLVAFLEQNGGELSKRVRTGEFEKLSPDEVERVEELYAECFPEEAPEPIGHA